MIYYTTKVAKLVDLAAELNRLVADSHTIFQLIEIDGFTVIISTK